ncbi:MAG: WYL domain-containing protein, partial [Acidobacteria bacterium]
MDDVQRDGGRLRMTLKGAANAELVGWVLSVGDGVRVVEPPELREAVQTAAERIC